MNKPLEWVSVAAAAALTSRSSARMGESIAIETAPNTSNSALHRFIAATVNCVGNALFSSRPCVASKGGAGAGVTRDGYEYWYADRLSKSVSCRLLRTSY